MYCHTKNHTEFYSISWKIPYQNTPNVYHLYSIVMAEETSSTDLEEINTDDERVTDISNWSDKRT